MGSQNRETSAASASLVRNLAESDYAADRSALADVARYIVRADQRSTGRDRPKSQYREGTSQLEDLAGLFIHRKWANDDWHVSSA
jgi:hypothetical protein